MVCTTLSLNTDIMYGGGKITKKETQNTSLLRNCAFALRYICKQMPNIPETSPNTEYVPEVMPASVYASFLKTAGFRKRRAF